jgi:hypothetical protein
MRELPHILKQFILKNGFFGAQVQIPCLRQNCIIIFEKYLFYLHFDFLNPPNYHKCTLKHVINGVVFSCSLCVQLYCNTF